VTRIYRQDALRYLKVQASQLRAWEQKELIPHRDSYTLEEYGRLRTLRDLSQRFSPSIISASLGAMKNVSGLENPLLEARAVVGGPRVLFRHRGSVTEPIARQFVFDFDPAPSTPSGSADSDAAPIAFSQTNREARLSEMFQEAVRCEESGVIEQAAASYELILQSNPHHAATCINLGTICYNRRQFVRAEELYRRATLADPEYALAFFDLGNVLDELKRLPEAITAYRTAIRLVPSYADAHYNLALCYERLGERRPALRHWSAYLKLDAKSRWATHARKQVKKILGHESLAIVHRSHRAPTDRLARKTTTLPTQVPTAG
jgi:tetratricopeptide (TPR) repeat protein